MTNPSHNKASKQPVDHADTGHLYPPYSRKGRGILFCARATASAVSILYLHNNLVTEAPAHTPTAHIESPSTTTTELFITAPSSGLELPIAGTPDTMRFVKVNSADGLGLSSMPSTQPTH